MVGSICDDDFWKRGGGRGDGGVTGAMTMRASKSAEYEATSTNSETKTSAMASTGGFERFGGGGDLEMVKVPAKRERGKTLASFDRSRKEKGKGKDKKKGQKGKDKEKDKKQKKRDKVKEEQGEEWEQPTTVAT